MRLPTTQAVAQEATVTLSPSPARPSQRVATTGKAASKATARGWCTWAIKTAQQRARGRAAAFHEMGPSRRRTGRFTHLLFLGEATSVAAVANPRLSLRVCVRRWCRRCVYLLSAVQVCQLYRAVSLVPLLPMCYRACGLLLVGGRALTKGPPARCYFHFCISEALWHVFVGRLFVAFYGAQVLMGATCQPNDTYFVLLSERVAVHTARPRL